jgi:hypothetical protein
MPVMTTNLFLGMATSMFLRLCTLAPFIMIFVCGFLSVSLLIYRLLDMAKYKPIKMKLTFIATKIRWLL